MNEAAPIRDRRPDAGATNGSTDHAPSDQPSVDHRLNRAPDVPLRDFAIIGLFLIEDACRLGWNPTPALHGTPHGQYSVLCEFVCCCGRAPRLPINPAKVK